MKPTIKNVSEFAEAHGLTRQAIENRLKAGWQFGALDGNAVMYPPSVMPLKGYAVIEVVITNQASSFSKREFRLIKEESK